MKFLLYSAALSACLYSSAAQAQTAAADSVAVPANSFRVFRPVRYQWDVSVDASFLLPRVNQPVIYSPSTYSSPLNNYSPYDIGRSTTLMLRKNEVIRNEANVPVRQGAYRLNLNWAADYGLLTYDSLYVVAANLASTALIVEDKARFSGFGLTAGYEWQQQLGRFQIFYGADAFVSFYGDKRTGHLFFDEADPNNPGLYNRRSKEVSLLTRRTSVGLTPLVGAKFFLHPRVSFSLENVLFVRYTWNYQRSDYSNFVVQRTAKGRGLATGVTPLSAFNLTFHFGKVVR
jgi:hypothetical protein